MGTCRSFVTWDDPQILPPSWPLIFSRSLWGYKEVMILSPGPAQMGIWVFPACLPPWTELDPDIHVQCLSQDVCNASGRAQWSSSAGEASGACRYSAGSYLPSDSTCPSTSVTVSSSASIEATPFLCPQQLPAVCLYSCPRVFPPARSHLTFMPLDSSVRAVWAALCLVHIQPRPPVSCSAFTSCSPQGSKGLSCFPGPDILYSSKPKYWSVVQGKETVSVPSSKYPKLVLSLHALYVLCFPTVPLDTGDTWYILQHQER